MEKNKKNEKGLNKILFLGEIGSTGWQGDFTATPDQCLAIAKRFDIPQVVNVSAHICATIDGEIIRVTGHINALLKRTCVISLNTMNETLNTDFEALFAENVPFIRDGEMKEDIEPLFNGKLDIFEIITEQIGLNMEPFPHSTNISGDYTEQADSGNHPFANLKNLLKKD